MAGFAVDYCIAAVDFDSLADLFDFVDLQDFESKVVLAGFVDS